METGYSWIDRPGQTKYDLRHLDLGHNNSDKTLQIYMMFTFVRVPLSPFIDLSKYLRPVSISLGCDLWLNESIEDIR